MPTENTARIDVIVRVILGGLLTFRGLQAVMAFSQSRIVDEGLMFAVLGAVELLGGLLLLCGLFTRVAATVMTAEILMSFFWLYFSGRMTTIPERLELTAMYAVTCYYVASRQRHSLSLDHLLHLR